MKTRKTWLALGLMAVLSAPAHPSFAQTATLKSATPIAASAPTAVPSLVPYSGLAPAIDGKPLAGESGITFQIYKDEVGGEALWTESQTVAVDATGHYKVQLGATNPNGLPADLFSTGEARWLEVQFAGEAPQARVLLASVPYALKAGDAATLGGLPVSAFALAGARTAPTLASVPGFGPDANSNVTTPGGTTGYLPVFTGTTTVADSILFSTATGIGVGDVPNSTAVFDVNGKSIWRGLLNVSRAGTATAASGFDSYPMFFQASSYNSSTHAAVLPNFQIQVEPTGNNTAAPGATFNLLSSATGGTPAETGFFFNSNGTLHFAPGQTFPGTGPGTITGVTAGTALTGGGTSGNVTLNLDLTKVPELAKTNTFTGTQTIGGGDLDLPATTGATVGVLNIGGVPFLHGYTKANDNVFVGNAGNFKTTGFDTAGVGFGALANLTSGFANTATGSGALLDDTTGNENTGVGIDTLFSVSTGGSNTAIGAFANVASGALSNTTELGADATAGQSNTLILGNTDSTPGGEFVNVGIGTETPISALEISVNAAGAIGPALTLTNSVSNGSSTYSGNAAAINFYTYPVKSSVQPGAQISAVDNGADDPDFSLDNLVFSSEYPDGQFSFLQQNMIIYAGGQVVLGTNPDDTSSPNNALLTVLQPYPGGQDGINTIGASSVVPANGIVATGGTNTEPGASTDYGGTGGVFIGGDGDGGGIGGDGILAQTNSDSLQSSPGYAGVFEGDVIIDGTLFADAKDFKIDHPLDPANKYLMHTSVESSEMMNIYTGNVTTDELGIATITLPDWFESLNTDFRYQLTTIGRDAHAWISQEIANKQFKISTNASNVKVSWQVTAVRQDAYAKAHPMIVEVEKPARERGFYQHPEFYGQPATKQTEWGRHPQMMQHLKAQQAAAKTASVAVGHVKHQSGAPASAVNRTFTHHAAPQVKPIAAVKP
jgi:hypothetical protein